MLNNGALAPSWVLLCYKVSFLERKVTPFVALYFYNQKKAPRGSFLFTKYAYQSLSVWLSFLIILSS
jgi:uncharacterized membrane protein